MLRLMPMIIGATALCGPCGFADDPVPPQDDQARAFASDRPGKSQSPITVDAGTFQIESDIATYIYDRDGGQTTRLATVAAPVLKLGVADWADLELGFTLYESQHSTDRAAGQSQAARGFGDMTVAAKANLIGDDGGERALAVDLSVKLPVAAAGLGNNGVEGVLGLPFSQSLPAGWSLALEPAAGLFRNPANSGYHADVTGTVGVSHSVLSDDLTLALELFGFIGGARGEPDYATFDPSLAWMVTPDLQLDLGVYVGLDRAAPDWNPYCGISARF